MKTATTKLKLIKLTSYDHYVPHCISSDLSAQSRKPSQRWFGQTHSPSVHWNWSGCLHDTKAYQ